MPVYEYYCQSCRSTFEQLRPMSRASEPAVCPAGHPGAGRVVSLFAARSKEGDGSTSSTLLGGGCAGCAGGVCTTCGR